MNIAAISHALATLAFLLLGLLLLTAWRRRGTGSWVVMAVFLSTAWAATSWLVTLAVIPGGWLQWAELGRDAGWLVFLLHLLSPGEKGRRRTFGWREGLFGLLALSTAILIALPLFGAEGNTELAWRRDLLIICWIGFSILGLLLVEQLFRGATAGQRWALKYLCLGLGGIFAYDFYLFADALLFKRINPDLWQVRGLVNALAVPLLAISIARNPDWNLRIHVSRQVVFHSVTLAGAGIYLLAMAGVGYLLRQYGGDWGALLQTAFLAGALILLGVMLFSDRIRARLRVILSKHFFSYKYDYRDEWMRFTRTLDEGADSVPERIIHAMAALVGSRGGMLWARAGTGDFEPLAQWNMPPVEAGPGGWEPVVAFLRQRQWIIDLDEYYATPSLYDPLELPAWILEIPDAWLLVPLTFKEDIVGLLLLKRSDLTRALNWEDRDLLKIAAMQAAGNLAQYLSDQALMQARQFEAFNRLSAYVVHDLKNILAQQSLIVSNAERHKHNPAFVDDVIATVKNSVERMTRLMEQMRSGMRGARQERVALIPLLGQVVERHARRDPVPSLVAGTAQPVVMGDPEQLATVFGHLVQNAQEATEKGGEVTVEVGVEGTQAVVTIRDTGCGMDSDFIRNRLFRPFDSTKGLTGMGIGAFESREIIRALGGDIQVESRPGEGSVFRITIPLTDG
ncbi:MAG: PEP-CTERM system histidine kinase PrsK [Gammaproteobacteria bacterium]|nr:MAG: PEP-CTERM system histidine kinase PrsK [Gammaproteobacteria bacterium]